jgi:Zn-dependent alcohol dehydrogenase
MILQDVLWRQKSPLILCILIFSDDLGFYGTYITGHSSRFTLKGGETARQFVGTSTFSEYTVVPEIQVAKVCEQFRW